MRLHTPRYINPRTLENPLEFIYHFHLCFVKKNIILDQPHLLYHEALCFQMFKTEPICGVKGGKGRVWAVLSDV